MGIQATNHRRRHSKQYLGAWTAGLAALANGGLWRFRKPRDRNPPRLGAAHTRSGALRPAGCEAAGNARAGRIHVELGVWRVAPGAAAGRIDCQDRARGASSRLSRHRHAMHAHDHREEGRGFPLPLCLCVCASKKPHAGPRPAATVLKQRGMWLAQERGRCACRKACLGSALYARMQLTQIKLTPPAPARIPHHPDDRQSTGPLRPRQPPATGQEGRRRIEGASGVSRSVWRPGGCSNVVIGGPPGLLFAGAVS